MTRTPAGSQRGGSTTKTPLDSRPVNAPKSSGSVGPSFLLDLQRTAGNQAVTALLEPRPTIQRLASGATLLSELGGPSKHSKTYRAIVADLNAYDTSLGKALDPDDSDAMLRDARKLDLQLRRVINTCDLFLRSRKKDARVPRLTELRTDAARERATLRLLMAQIGRGTKPTAATWKDAVGESTTTATRDLTAEKGVEFGTNKGGMNAITKLRGRKIGGQSGRETGWQRRNEMFKADKEKVDVTLGNEPLYAEGIGIPLGAGEDVAKFRREWHLEEDAERDKRGPRFAARAAASSRIDQLLNANVIAKTQLAVQHTPDGPVHGQIMAKAQGVNAAHLASLAKKGEAGGFDIDDPDLQRMMSKLDLLDSLCGQIDRHGGNVFIGRDGKTGKVTSVTGIDNDLAFGTKKFVPGQPSPESTEYGGVGKYIDEETGEAILALTADDLQAVLGDLLLPDEVDAAVDRLVKLQEILRTAQAEGRLIGPDRWGKETVGTGSGSGGYISNTGYHSHRFHG